MSEGAPEGYKLVLVPMDRVFALTRGIPQQARITGNATFEVVADVEPDRKIRMSRELFEQVEVSGAVAIGREDLERVYDYARHFDVDSDPAMVRVAEVLRTSEQPAGSSPPAAD